MKGSGERRREEDKSCDSRKGKRGGNPQQEQRIFELRKQGKKKRVARTNRKGRR